MPFSELKPKVTEIVTTANLGLEKRLLYICKLLQKEVEYYDWVGFYFKNGTKDELKLGPYVGDLTDHAIIPFGKGICGQVALSNKTFMVPDVSTQDNYLSCNINVKSEIVVPIFVDQINVGQLDIDSKTLNPFTKSDENFLAFVCKEVSKLL